MEMPHWSTDQLLLRGNEDDGAKKSFCAYAVILTCWCPLLIHTSAHAAVTKDEVDAAKNEVALRIYKATGDLLVLQKEAEARQPVAQAEKAEFQAKLPSTDAKALAGTVNIEKFGAAGQVKAFDLAKDLAKDLCARMPEKFSIYDEGAVKNAVNAKAAQAALVRLVAQLQKQSLALDPYTKLLKSIPAAENERSYSSSSSGGRNHGN
jgi:hypothetical protein